MNRYKLLIGAAALALAACGGGDGLTELQREDRAASATVAGLIAVASNMIATQTSDASGPRPIDGISPPTTEVDEPVPL
jgi:hypothetical protein